MGLDARQISGVGSLVSRGEKVGLCLEHCCWSSLSNYHSPKGGHDRGSNQNNSGSIQNSMGDLPLVGFSGYLLGNASGSLFHPGFKADLFGRGFDAELRTKSTASMIPIFTALDIAPTSSSVLAPSSDALCS